MNTYGRKTRSTVMLASEAHKFHRAFRVATGSIVRKTMPVKLDSTGKLVPLANTDNRNLCIGYSIHDASAGEVATVVMKGYALILCKADSSGVTAGVPVAYSSYVSESPSGTGATALPTNPTEEFYGMNVVTAVAATDAKIFGQATETAAANGLLEVVVLA